MFACDRDFIEKACHSSRSSRSRITAQVTVNHLKRSAERGGRENLLAVLAKAPDGEPKEVDRL